MSFKRSPHLRHLFYNIQINLRKESDRAQLFSNILQIRVAVRVQPQNVLS